MDRVLLGNLFLGRRGKEKVRVSLKGLACFTPRAGGAEGYYSPTDPREYVAVNVVQHLVSKHPCTWSRLFDVWSQTLIGVVWYTAHIAI